MTVPLVGDDWAGDYHDAGLTDQAGRTLARALLSQGAAGMARLHALIGEHVGAGDGEDEPYGTGRVSAPVNQPSASRTSHRAFAYDSLARV
jgi:hypothetical protein